MLRAFIIFLSLLLLWTLTAQVNHYLAPFQIYLFLGGLYVTYAALRLPLGAGYIAVLTGGLLCDANATSNLWFGTHAVLFAGAFAIIFTLRDRMARDETLIRVAVALIANLGLFLAFSFPRIALAPMPSTAWVRLFLDLFCSQIVLVIFAPWFFALQSRSLQLAHSDAAAAN